MTIFALASAAAAKNLKTPNIQRLGVFSASALGVDQDKLFDFLRGCKFAAKCELIWLSKDNLNSVDAIYLTASNPFFLMHSLRAAGLSHLARKDLCIIAQEHAAIALAPSLICSRAFMIAAQPSYEALNLLSFHIQIGELSASVLQENAELCALWPDMMSIFLPEYGALKIEDGRILTIGGAVKINQAGHHHYNCGEYIPAPNGEVWGK